jgi:hypothetical protein
MADANFSTAPRSPCRARHRVVKLPTLLNQHLGFLQRIENLPIQTLVPQFPIKGFAVSVLPRTSRLDEQRFVPTDASHCFIRRAVISAPFMQSPSSSITRALFNRRATRIAKHSRVNSSIITSKRRLRPSCVRASTNRNSRRGCDVTVAVECRSRRSRIRSVYLRPAICSWSSSLAVESLLERSLR